MQALTPLRHLNPAHQYGSKDVFVLFGELFARGYANGLVDEAKKAGMKIVGITVGRRDADGTLRALTPEELAEAEANLGGTIINVPLMAGFDQDPALDGSKPVEWINSVKASEWESTKIDWEKAKQAQIAGTQRLVSSIQKSMEQINALIPDGAKVLFAHTMAGGIPRAKVLLMLTNRTVKGKGDKFLSSANFWGSDIGRLVQENFYAVSADTLQHLLDGSKGIRERIEKSGGQVSYTAYGYHGTEVLVGGKLQWQTYNPYLQGLAKIRLEEIAVAAWQKGIKATVFNCPEIRTNSSDLFSGVELSLYPLITALEKEGKTPWVQSIRQGCQAKLKAGHTVDEMLHYVDQYHQNPVVQSFYQQFEKWPMHNTAELAEIMLTTSDGAMDMNETHKDVVTDLLSEVVVDSCGTIMINEAYKPTAPVYWIGHDIIAKEQVAKHG